MQQILLMETYTDSMRSEAYGWGIECGDTAKKDFGKAVLRSSNKFTNINQTPVGYAGHPSGLFYTHATPLHALADGWHLMAPPTKGSMKTDDEKYAENGGMRDYWEWWFEKTSPAASVMSFG